MTQLTIIATIPPTEEDDAFARTFLLADNTRTTRLIIDDLVKSGIWPADGGQQTNTVMLKWPDMVSLLIYWNKALGNGHQMFAGSSHLFEKIRKDLEHLSRLRATFWLTTNA